MSIEPKNRTIDEGERTTFTCKASGVGSDSFTYQWYLNNHPITGENKKSLNITASLADSGSYKCSVKNQYGSTSHSEEVMLIILSAYVTSYVFLNLINLYLFSRPVLQSSNTKLQ